MMTSHCRACNISFALFLWLCKSLLMKNVCFGHVIITHGAVPSRALPREPRLLRHRPRTAACTPAKRHICISHSSGAQASTGAEQFTTCCCPAAGTINKRRPFLTWKDRREVIQDVCRRIHAAHISIGPSHHVSDSARIVHVGRKDALHIKATTHMHQATNFFSSSYDGHGCCTTNRSARMTCSVDYGHQKLHINAPKGKEEAQGRGSDMRHLGPHEGNGVLVRCKVGRERGLGAQRHVEHDELVDLVWVLGRPEQCVLRSDVTLMIPGHQFGEMTSTTKAPSPSCSHMAD